MIIWNYAKHNFFIHLRVIAACPLSANYVGSLGERIAVYIIGVTVAESR